MATLFQPTGQERLINLDHVTHIDYNQRGQQIIFCLASEIRGVSFIGVEYQNPNAYATDVSRLRGLHVVEQIH